MLAGIVEFLGWFGAVTVLAGYLLFSMGKLSNGPVYQLFNLVGGLAVAINVAAHHAIPSTIVNGIWAVVAVVVLVRMGRTRRAARRGVPSVEQPALHTEPLATTAVLPVIGPALRDHEPEATDATRVDPGLPAAPGAQAVTDAPGVVAPMTASIPVITATIALALVAAARDQAADRAEPSTTEPQHADASPV